GPGPAAVLALGKGEGGGAVLIGQGGIGGGVRRRAGGELRAAGGVLRRPPLAEADAQHDQQRRRQDQHDGGQDGHNASFSPGHGGTPPIDGAPRAGAEGRRPGARKGTIIPRMSPLAKGGFSPGRAGG